MHKTSSLVAVVEDEESVRKAIGRLLLSAGFNVETYCCAADFLQSLHRQRPRCLVLDLRMPNMSGFEIQQALSQSGNVVPVVIITGDDSPGSRERALVQGARAYLRKPVDEAMLLDAIDSAIHSGSAP
jgi:FixJ family two-component response regulator